MLGACQRGLSFAGAPGVPQIPETSGKTWGVELSRLAPSLRALPFSGPTFAGLLEKDCSASPRGEQMSEITQSMRRVTQSPAFKFVLICFLILLLLIPLLLVVGLVFEREGRANEVKSEVSRTWGGAQQLSGPFLVVPYTVRSETKEGDKVIELVLERRAVFLPNALTITGNAKSGVLHRSIFDVPVYTATLSLEGGFDKPDMAEVDANATSVRWREAVLVLALSDVAGLKEASTIKINGTNELAFAPSVGVPGRA